jgi:hypothetical protein
MKSATGGSRAGLERQLFVTALTALAWTALLLTVLFGCGPGGAPGGGPAVGAGGPGSDSAASAPSTVRHAAPAPGADVQAHGVGFRSRERLEEHFAKHGQEFGEISIEEYLARAQRLRDAPVGGDILELRRPRGFARLDRATGAFGAYDDDGTIRTFFRPRDGESYFRRQAQRYGD